MDVNEFDQLASGALHNLDTLERRARLYQGDFLTNFNIAVSYEFEAWTLGERARLKDQMMELLHHLAERHAQRSEMPQAIATMRNLLQLEPWREKAHRQLMELLARNGDRSAALKQYTLCRNADWPSSVSKRFQRPQSSSTNKRILNDEVEPLLVPTSVISTPQPPVEHLLLPTEDIPVPSVIPTGSIMPLSKNSLFTEKGFCHRILIFRRFKGKSEVFCPVCPLFIRRQL